MGLEMDYVRSKGQIIEKPTLVAVIQISGIVYQTIKKAQVSESRAIMAVLFSLFLKTGLINKGLGLDNVFLHRIDRVIVFCRHNSPRGRTNFFRRREIR